MSCNLLTGHAKVSSTPYETEFGLRIKAFSSPLMLPREAQGKVNVKTLVSIDPLATIDVEVMGHIGRTGGLTAMQKQVESEWLPAENSTAPTVEDALKGMDALMKTDLYRFTTESIQSEITACRTMIAALASHRPALRPPATPSAPWLCKWWLQMQHFTGMLRLLQLLTTQGATRVKPTDAAALNPFVCWFSESHQSSYASLQQSGASNARAKATKRCIESASKPASSSDTGTSAQQEAEAAVMAMLKRKRT
eukprot:6489896-Amphidinium_carterae.1